jgi:hypothetical protein
VDVDGHGFKANGDTLGYDLPVMGISADRAKQLLERGGKATPPTPAMPSPNGEPKAAPKKL